MTQAPTPGPLSEAQIQAVMLAAMEEVRPSITDDAEASSMDADIARLKEGLVDMGETGWAVMRATARRFADLLAPTAPVEASGSEREDDEPTEPEMQRAEVVSTLLRYSFEGGAACDVADEIIGLLRPQPSGETR